MNGSPPDKPAPPPFFQRATGRLSIASLDDPGNDPAKQTVVTAQYNPKEIQISRKVPWSKHDVLSAATKAQAVEAARINRGQSHLEFGGSESRTLTLELLFDGFETGTSVLPEVNVLETLATVRNPSEPNEEFRRPHFCSVTWGTDGLPPFRCVIESLDVKLTMFTKSGLPVRAVCTVALKEATVVSLSNAARDQYSGQRTKPPRS